MDEARRTKTSKFMSFVLRHQPQAAGLELDAGGWVEVDRLLAACAKHGHRIDRRDLEEIVATSPKQRFGLSSDGLRIRANQGHSVEVDLGHAPVEPPAVLFHGTVRRFLASIREAGLQRMERHHVHLSAEEATAREVGRRRGEPVLLRIDAAAMWAVGHRFYRSDNGVWLTNEVPPAFIDGLD